MGAAAALQPAIPLLRMEEPAPEGVVEVARYKAGFDQARTEEDLKQLFKDNLDADMAGFRRRAWSIKELAEFVLRFDHTVPRHEQGEGNAALVILRNGTAKVQWLRGKDNHWRMACIQAAINGAKSLRFPDSAFIVNIDDFPVCVLGRCPLPVFTMYKKWDAKRGGNFETNEVLMPVFNHHYEDLYSFPWDRKRSKAFMRASQQGCMVPNSTRAVLAVLSEDHPDRLDLGITRIDGAQKHDLKHRFSKAGFVTIEDHAKWKYQVSADGCVAQSRLAKVLLSNSVVLKEESAWIEYYYRSLRPWKHYVPLPEGDGSARVILSLVDQLRGDDRRAQHLAESAQKWAYRFLPNYPRLLYFRKTLVEYNALFGGAMEHWVKEFGPEALFPSNGKLDQGSGGPPPDALLSEAEREHVRLQQERYRRRRRRQMTRAAVEALAEEAKLAEQQRQFAAAIAASAAAPGGKHWWLRQLRKLGPGRL
ncbi:hypothetical protein Rsub_09270 [Raphidocelis subcapitata]|uniref:Glycosyl transferase CAP10 domain-containing protein n=1 Tax=Raphidocelis subcapitata TaxID=307507 RepID=A0A2V0P9F1_9CHLO|nr:hypothetical protein Rsub_09270 [Raphidocelis subcapitata]|eukprot:GBF96471.1 hypothetical protein Rsub_09270 [Raphidocelis subcapitata]